MSRSGRTSVASLLKTKSLGTVGFLAVLAFYVAWPLYAGYEIKTSLDTHNVEALNARIDFPSVRVSLKPAVAAKVDKVVTDALRRAGTMGGALADKLKGQVTPRIVDGVLNALVTPEMLIRIHTSGKSLKEVLDGLSDTFDSLASHRLNEVIKALTVISVIILPLTLITSIFGMNVPLPYEHSPYALLIISAIMLAIMFVAAFLAVGMLAHLVTLLTGRPFTGRSGF